MHRSQTQIGDKGKDTLPRLVVRASFPQVQYQAVFVEFWLHCERSVLPSTQSYEGERLLRLLHSSFDVSSDWTNAYLKEWTRTAGKGTSARLYRQYWSQLVAPADDQRFVPGVRQYTEGGALAMSCILRFICPAVSRTRLSFVVDVRFCIDSSVTYTVGTNDWDYHHVSRYRRPRMARSQKNARSM